MPKLFRLAASVLIAASTCVACAHQPASLPNLASRGQQHVLLVETWDAAQSVRSYRWSAWRRVEDDSISGPIYFVITAAHQACLVPASLFPLMYRGLPVSCDWRPARQLRAVDPWS